MSLSPSSSPGSALQTLVGSGHCLMLDRMVSYYHTWLIDELLSLSVGWKSGMESVRFTQVSWDLE